MYFVNQRGSFLTAQACARAMLKQEPPGGVIVNVASEAGLEGSSGQSVYSGTKAAMYGYTRSWAKELGGQGIRVLGVAPGVRTPPPESQRASYPLPPSPRRVAPAAASARMKHTIAALNAARMSKEATSGRRSNKRQRSRLTMHHLSRRRRRLPPALLGIRSRGGEPFVQPPPSNQKPSSPDLPPPPPFRPLFPMPLPSSPALPLPLLTTTNHAIVRSWRRPASARLSTRRRSPTPAT